MFYLTMHSTHFIYGYMVYGHNFTPTDVTVYLGAYKIYYENGRKGFI